MTPVAYLSFLSPLGIKVLVCSGQNKAPLPPSFFINVAMVISQCHRISAIIQVLLDGRPDLRYDCFLRCQEGIGQSWWQGRYQMMSDRSGGLRVLLSGLSFL